MRVPTITNVYPPKIYNMATVKQIDVTGRDFLNTERLICLLRQSIKIRAIFESDNRLYCKFKGFIDLSDTSQFSLAISNDNGNTYSNEVIIEVAIKLP